MNGLVRPGEPQQPPPKPITTVGEPYWDRSRGILHVGGSRHGQWMQPILRPDGKPAKVVRIPRPVEITVGMFDENRDPLVTDLPTVDDHDEYNREVISQRNRAGDVVRQQYIYRATGTLRSMVAFTSALHIGFCEDSRCEDELHQWPPRRQLDGQGSPDTNLPAPRPAV